MGQELLWRVGKLSRASRRCSNFRYGNTPIPAAQFAADTNSYTLSRQRENIAGVEVELAVLTVVAHRF